MRSFALSFAIERCATSARMSAVCVLLLINNRTTPSKRSFFQPWAILVQSVAIPPQCDVQRSGLRPSTIARFQRPVCPIVSARLPPQKSPSHLTMEVRTLISPCSRPPETVSKGSSRSTKVSLFDLAQRYHFPAPDVPCPASPQLRDKPLDTDQIAGKGFMSFCTSSGFILQHKERS